VIAYAIGDTFDFRVITSGTVAAAVSATVGVA
jgi:hypothetical protein